MLTVRPAAAGDNGELLALVKAGTGGAIDRNDDFFARSRLYPGSRVYVAVEDDHVVGTVSRATKTVRVGGREVLASYLFDLDYHHPFFDELLLTRCAEDDAAEGVSLSYLQLLTGNPRSGRRFLVWDYAAVAQVWLAVLLPDQALPGAAPAGVRTAAPADYPAIAALLNLCYRDYEFYVPFTAGSLAEMIAQTPGYVNLSVYEREGEILACLGYLDYRAVYRFVHINQAQRPRQGGSGPKYLLPWLPEIDTPWNGLIPFPIGYRDSVDDLGPLWQEFSRRCSAEKVPGLLRFDQREPIRALERREASAVTTSPMLMLAKTYGGLRLPGPQRLVYTDPRDL